MTADTFLAELLTKAEEALWCAPPSLVFLAPGAEVAWDECCEGQLWIRVIRAHPVDPPPSKTFNVNGCGYRLGIQIGLGVIRCQTGLDSQDASKHPTAAQLTADAVTMLRDAGALERVLCAAELIIDQWTPLGPKGGCYGGEWTAWLTDLQFPDCGEESE